MSNNHQWFLYTIITMLAWGVWGALINFPTAAGFPETLGYVVWSVTMIPPALIALRMIEWNLDRDKRSLLLGAAAGLLGAGGQLTLFKTVQIAPAYLVFPFIALSPLVTVLLAAVLARERVNVTGRLGIIAAISAGVLLAISPQSRSENFGSLWVALALAVLLAWGVQGFVISHANKTMRAESIFFYMSAAAFALAPVAWAMTDFGRPINWGITGPYLAAAIQLLNSIGALLLVYAFRFGKAMIVAPLINAGAPMITIIVSLAMARATPNPWQIVGMALAIVATVLVTIESEEQPVAEAGA